PELSPSELLVLEGGAAKVGIESTIVDVSRVAQGIAPVLLRPGHISAAQIAEVLGREPGRPDAAAPQVSGSLKAHYAPRTPLMLLPLERLLTKAEDTSAGRTVAIVFDTTGVQPLAGVDWLECSSNPDIYARDLYALLRRLDGQGYDRILMQQPPSTAAWQAVNDRIGRAAAAFDPLSASAFTRPGRASVFHDGQPAWRCLALRRHCLFRVRRSGRYAPAPCD